MHKNSFTYIAFLTIINRMQIVVMYFRQLLYFKFHICEYEQVNIYIYNI